MERALQIFSGLCFLALFALLAWNPTPRKEPHRPTVPAARWPEHPDL